MKSIHLVTLASFLSISVAFPLAAQQVEVVHQWTSGGDAAAAKILSDAYKAAGGEWIDTAIAGREATQASIINRIAGGNPPSAGLFQLGRQSDDLIEAGYLRNLDDVATKDGWKANITPAIFEAISKDGHVYAIPLSLQAQNWLYSSKKVLAEAGVTGEIKTWDDFLAALDKVKAAGLIGLSLSGNASDESSLFAFTLLAKGGPDLYQSVYVDKDKAALLSADFLAVAKAFRDLKIYIDPGSPGRAWNESTAQVINHKAGFNISGDWARGEFLRAGQKPGVDYNCQLGVTDRNALFHGDIFVLPKLDNAVGNKAGDLLAEVATDPKTQVAFNKVKGGVPARTDTDLSTFDQCSQKLAKLYKVEGAALPGIATVFTPIVRGAVQDAITQFWNNDSITADQFASNLATAFDAQ